jgi:hypothetical protein
MKGVIGSEKKYVFMKKFGKRNELEMRILRKKRFVEMLNEVGGMGGKIGVELNWGDGVNKKVFIQDKMRLNEKLKGVISLKEIEEGIEKGNFEVKILRICSL